MQGTKPRKRKSISYDKYGYIFVAPFFITFLIFQLYPIFFTFRTSLTDAAGWSKVLENSIIGFDNFVKLFSFETEVSKFFWLSLSNTVKIWIVNFIPQIGMALLLASWFTDTRLRLRCQGAFKVMIFMPNIITAATIAMLFFSFFNFPIAPINTLMQQFGLLSSPYEFFRSTAASRDSISSMRTPNSFSI